MVATVGLDDVPVVSLQRGPTRQLRQPRASRSRTLQIDFPSEPTVRIACDRRELLAAYRLVYRRYSERGYVGPGRTDILYSTEFGEPSSRTLVVVDGFGDVTATATIVSEPPGNQAQQSVIPWDLIRRYDRRRKLAGVTCLAATDSATGPKPAAFLSLTRFLFQYARSRDIGGLAIAIHPRHVRFYRRICPIVPLSAVYRQEKLGGSLAVACRIDLDARSLKRVPPSVLTWFEQPIPQEELNRPGISPLCNAYLSQYAGRAG